jgi:hypothetical protein
MDRASIKVRRVFETELNSFSRPDEGTIIDEKCAAKKAVEPIKNVINNWDSNQKGHLHFGSVRCYAHTPRHCEVMEQLSVFIRKHRAHELKCHRKHNTWRENDGKSTRAPRTGSPKEFKFTPRGPASKMSSCVNNCTDTQYNAAYRMNVVKPMKWNINSVRTMVTQTKTYLVYKTMENTKVIISIFQKLPES